MRRGLIFGCSFINHCKFLQKQSRGHLWTLKRNTIGFFANIVHLHSLSRSAFIVHRSPSDSPLSYCLEFLMLVFLFFICLLLDFIDVVIYTWRENHLNIAYFFLWFCGLRSHCSCPNALVTSYTVLPTCRRLGEPCCRNIHC